MGKTSLIVGARGVKLPNKVANKNRVFFYMLVLVYPSKVMSGISSHGSIPPTPEAAAIAVSLVWPMLSSTT